MACFAWGTLVPLSGPGFLPVPLRCAPEWGARFRTVSFFVPAYFSDESHPQFLHHCPH